MLGSQAMASIRQTQFSHERLGWLVDEIQHLPFCTHLQAFLVGEGGLHKSVAYPVDFFPLRNKPCSNISRWACCWEQVFNHDELN